MFKLISRIVLSLALLMTPCPVFAETGVPNSGHWEFRWFGGGGWFPALTPDNFTPGKFYMTSDIGAPLVTTDYAEHWTWLSYNSNNGYDCGVGAGFLQSKRDPLLMFSVGGTSRSGICKSVNGGQTWRRVISRGASRGASNKMIMFSRASDDVLYAALDDGWIVKSVDRGETWSNLYRPNPFFVTAEAAELNTPAGTNVSPNKKTGVLNNISNILRGSVILTSADEVFTDDGAGKLISSLGGTPGSISYSSGTYILNFTNGPSTTTAAYSWASKDNWLYVNQSDTKIFSGNGARLKVYDLEGQTMSIITLSPTTVNPTINAPAPETYDTYVDGSTVEHLCVPAGIQVACTGDDATSWQYTGDAKSPGTNTTNNHKIKRLAVKRLSDGTIRYNVYLRLATNTAGAIWKYSIGGTTWTTSSLSRNKTMNPTFVNSEAEGGALTNDPNDENRTFLTTNFSNYRSTNGGATYFEKVTGAGQTVNHDVKIAPDDSVIACAMDVGCQWSRDHGVTWKNILPYNPPDAGVPYIGGHFWQFELAGTKTEWQNGQGRIFVTSNYWYDFFPRVHRCVMSDTPVCTPTFLTDKQGKLIKIGMYGDVIWDRGYIRAISKSKDETKIYVAMDGENCKVNPSLPADKCAPSGNNHQTGGLFLSTDDGRSFQQLWESPRKIYNALDVDPTDPTGKTLLFGTFAYNTYRSTNPGVTTPEFVGALDYTFDTAYDSNGHAYAGGSVSGAVIYNSVPTVYGNGDARWGTWKLMKRFAPTNITNTIVDAITIDPLNDNRVVVATVNGTYGSLTGNRVYLTKDANKADKATWHDITGDLPAMTGCNALAFDYSFGIQGHLWCAASNGLFALDLADTPEVDPGVTGIGVLE